MFYIEILKEFMLKNSLTQQKLADILEINQTTVSQWLLGHKKPSYDNIQAIYYKLGIFPNELFDLSIPDDTKSE